VARKDYVTSGLGRKDYVTSGLAREGRRDCMKEGLYEGRIIT
jgi:hypothetical protein